MLESELLDEMENEMMYRNYLYDQKKTVESKKEKELIDILIQKSIEKIKELMQNYHSIEE